MAGLHVRNPSVWPPYLSWCPDSKCLVVTDSPGESKLDALFVVSVETGEKKPLTNPRPPASGDTNPAVSPDGRWLVFRREANGPFSGELYRLALGRGVTPVGEPQRLTEAALNAGSPTWMPDSKEILIAAPSLNGHLWRLDLDGYRPGESQPARLPYVGEDGLMPVVSRPQPGRAARLVYVRSFANSKSGALIRLLPERRPHRRLFSRFPPRDGSIIPSFRPTAAGWLLDRTARGRRKSGLPIRTGLTRSD